MKKKITAIIAAAVISVSAAVPMMSVDIVEYDSPAVYQAKAKKKGWVTKDGKKYYYDKDGKMVKNKWLTFKKSGRYYMTSTGAAAVGVYTVDDVEYKFADDGKCLGKNYCFFLNEDTKCLHIVYKECRAAEQIDEDNITTIDIGEDEFSEYSDNDYWACGICSKEYKDVFPKPDEKEEK